MTHSIEKKEKSYPLKITMPDAGEEPCATASALSFTVGGERLDVIDCEINEISNENALTATITVAIMLGK